MKIFTTSIMLLISTLSWAAEERIFIADKSLDCMPSIEAALIRRKWNISFIDQSSVKADVHSKGRGVAGKIHIFYKDGSFYYTGEGKRKNKKTDVGLPEVWVENLKKDVGACQVNGSSVKKDAKTRLEELQKLHKDGVISDHEYQELRKKVLESI